MYKFIQHLNLFLIFLGAFSLKEQWVSAIDTFSSIEEKSMHENFAQLANEPGSVMFTPPTGWRVADPKSLPPSVKIMVVGKGEREFPPSINLGTEEYQGTLKQYLKQIKIINSRQGNDWKDLGTIHTDAGDASYSQAIVKNEWGEVKMMHVILLKNGIIYILTAAALKNEFPQFYKEFFNAFRSLRINPDINEKN